MVKIKRKIPGQTLTHPAGRLGPPSPAAGEGLLRLHIEEPLARIAGEGAERSEASEGIRYQVLGSHHDADALQRP